MDIFYYENDIVSPTVEALLIPVFNEIWTRDRSSHKELAHKELAYVSFMVSPKKTNPFYGYTILDDLRHNKIIEYVIRTIPGWEPDELVLEGVDTYKELLYNASETLKYYEANKLAVEKVTKHLNDLDMGERNPKTLGYMHSAKSVTDGIKNADDVMVKLAGMKDKVEQELFDKSKSKAGRVINPFER